MQTAFEVDGVVVEDGYQKLLISVDPTIMSALADRLSTCPPASSRYEDKRHLALRALGHQVRNALPVFFGQTSPEDAGLEVYDPDDESDN